MKINPPHGREESDKIFLNCEYSGTTAGVRGDLLAFDITPNTNQPGIMENTWGLRVILHPGVGTVNGFDFLLSAGVLENNVQATPVPTAFNGAYRGKMVLAQCYGVHDSAKFGGANQAPGLAIITPSNSPGFPGSMSSASKALLASAIQTSSYYPQSVGWNIENSGGTFAPKAMFVKTMGMS